MPLDPGARLGSFLILAPLGSGGMGEIYRARDTRLEREVALKVLPRELSTDREGLMRFAQEARAASALNHPNIISIFEIGLAEGSPFIVMELIDGRTLRELIDAGTLNVKKSLDLAVQIAEGLSKAHEAGILHRDLKPENIMVTRDGFAKILDFGLAKLQAPSPSERGAAADLANVSLTQAGFVLGTPAYMSPEQASGRPLDFRSDQFAAGVIIYEMLSRRRTFQRATAVQTLSAVIQDDPEPIERLNPRVPPPLRWAIARCLSKDPEERYSATRDLARELKQIRDNLGQFVESSDPRLSASAAVPVAGLPAAAAGRPTASLDRAGAHAPSTAGATATPPAPAALTEAAPRSRRRRIGEFSLALLSGLALFGGGALTGVWFHGRQAGAPAANWKADLLLGAMTRVMAQRASPDGHTLAFVTLVGGASQVAVMKPSSGDWTVLTRRRAGSIYKVSWSRDGNKLFFDRVSDVALGIFTIPPLGGEERLILEDAQGPEPLADGSMLVVKRDASRNFQLHRFWPETGKLVPVGPPVAPEAVSWSVRAFPDGSAAVFWGRLAGGKDKARRVYRLDLSTGRAEPFSSQLPLAPPLAVASDGKSLLAFIVTGDLQQTVSVSPDGMEARLLFPVTGKPWHLDAAGDGSLYVDTMDNPAELLSFAAAGGVPERLAATAGSLVTSPVQLPDGAVLVPTQVLGRRRLLLASRDAQLRPFLDAAEQATPPVAVVGDKLLAFLSGNVGKPPLITLASIADGRIVKRLEASSGAAPQSLAAAPDGRTLYYIDAGSLFTIDMEGGSPKKLRSAIGVAVDLHTLPPSLVLQISDRDGVRLYRTDLGGATELPLLYQSPLRLASLPLSSAAVGPDGRVAVTVSSADSWFRQAALVDPLTGAVEKVPVAFEGDIFYPAWCRDGSLLGMGVSIRSSLWRFQVQTRPTGTD
ncbi:MAG: protein kinase domain-containing protein [Thermoanaerobaculia bacterium]